MGEFDLLGSTPSTLIGSKDYFDRVTAFSPRVEIADPDQTVAAFSALLQPEAQNESPQLTAAFEVGAAPTKIEASTDVSVDGPGFLVVEDSTGTSYLTKSASFTLNEVGILVDESGNQLQAHAYGAEDVAPAANDFSALQPVQLPFVGYEAVGSTQGSIIANLDANSTVIAVADLPSETSGANTKYSHKATIEALDKLGNKVSYDVFFSKTGENRWQMSIFNAAGRNQTSGSFPYAAGSLVTDPIDLTFDANGRLSSPSIAAANTIFPSSTDGGVIPNMQALTLYFAALTQSTNEFSFNGSTDGSPLSVLERYQIGDDGTVYAEYSGGTLQPRYRLAVATVENPDKLGRVTGDLLSKTDDSGSVLLGVAGQDGMGSIVAGASDRSDPYMQGQGANQLTPQQSYSPESTSSPLIDLLDALSTARG